MVAAWWSRMLKDRYKDRYEDSYGCWLRMSRGKWKVKVNNLRMGIRIGIRLLKDVG